MINYPCNAVSPVTGKLCTMSEGHAGPHKVGGPYHTIERFVIKCTEACVVHPNSDGQGKRWNECIWCGARTPYDPQVLPHTQTRRITMPSKPLTIEIPEPNRDGDCSALCPLYHALYGRVCGVEFSLRYGGVAFPYGRPGPGCPQFKVDPSCTFYPKGQCDRPLAKTNACEKCAKEKPT